MSPGGVPLVKERPAMDDQRPMDDEQQEEIVPDVMGLTLPEAREMLRDWRVSLTVTGVPGAKLEVDEDPDADPPWRVLRQELSEAGTVILTVAPEETLNVKERAD